MLDFVVTVWDVDESIAFYCLSFKANLNVHVNNFLITFEFLFRVDD